MGLGVVDHSGPLGLRGLSFREHCHFTGHTVGWQKGRLAGQRPYLSWEVEPKYGENTLNTRMLEYILDWGKRSHSLSAISPRA